MSKMIQTENLGRHFGEIRAVDGVTFSVGKGEVLGFLGPNGAGKSTTMKMLTCFLTPSFGKASLGGFDINEQSRDVRRIVGYLPENAPLYGEMEVVDLLRFVGEVRGIKGAKLSQAVDRVLQLTSLTDVTKQRIETLSKGFKRRVGLAQALIHDPGILILDEPTDGLDPNQKHEVRQLIRTMAAEKCIILSTHILEEVDEVCTRAIIIARGKIVADDEPDALRKRSKTAGSIVLTVDQSTLHDFADFKSRLERIAGIEAVTQEPLIGSHAVFSLRPHDAKQAVFALVREAEQQKWSFTDLRLEAGRLDDVFREITR